VVAAARPRRLRHRSGVGDTLAGVGDPAAARDRTLAGHAGRGGERDKKIRTEMSVSPNETAKTDDPDVLPEGPPRPGNPQSAVHCCGRGRPRNPELSADLTRDVFTCPRVPANPLPLRPLKLRCGRRPPLSSHSPRPATLLNRRPAGRWACST
jgi:hypothetical protein